MNNDAMEGAVIDFAFEELFDAYKRSVELQNVTNAIDARNQAKKIELELKSALDKLVVLGMNAESRWKDIQSSVSEKTS